MSTIHLQPLAKTKLQPIIQTNSSIKLKNALIPWEKVRTKNYATYFAIYAVDKAATTNRGYNYLTDWNTSVLQNVLTAILQSKHVEQKV